MSLAEAFDGAPFDDLYSPVTVGLSKDSNFEAAFSETRHDHDPFLRVVPADQGSEATRLSWLFEPCLVVLYH